MVASDARSRLHHNILSRRHLDCSASSVKVKLRLTYKIHATALCQNAEHAVQHLLGLKRGNVAGYSDQEVLPAEIIRHKNLQFSLVDFEDVFRNANGVACIRMLSVQFFGKFQSQNAARMLFLPFQTFQKLGLNPANVIRVKTRLAQSETQQPIGLLLIVFGRQKRPAEIVFARRKGNPYCVALHFFLKGLAVQISGAVRQQRSHHIRNPLFIGVIACITGVFK